MQSDNKIKIVVPEGEAFCLTEQIPRLIAEALHPVVETEDEILITGLQKVRKLHKLNTLWAPDDHPYKQPLEANDWEQLEAVWGDLPPVKLPLASSDFYPYERAFAADSSTFDWDLDLIVESGWGDVMARHRSEKAHIENLQQAIESGELRQFHPETGIPALTYYRDGRIYIEDLSQYLEKFHIQVVRSKSSPEKDSFEQWWHRDFGDLLEWANRLAKEKRDAGITVAKGKDKGNVSAQEIYEEIAIHISDVQSRRRSANPKKHNKSGVSASSIKTYLRNRGFKANPD